MSIAQLPSKIDKLTVHAEGEELGLLTHGSVHHYQPAQTERYVSLTMTKTNLDGYSSGSLHPIFSQNLPEGFNRRFIEQKLARYAKVNHLRFNRGFAIRCGTILNKYVTIMARLFE